MLDICQLLTFYGWVPNINRDISITFCYYILIHVSRANKAKLVINDSKKFIWIWLWLFLLVPARAKPFSKEEVAAIGHLYEALGPTNEDIFAAMSKSPSLSLRGLDKIKKHIYNKSRQKVLDIKNYFLRTEYDNQIPFYLEWQVWGQLFWWLMFC